MFLNIIRNYSQQIVKPVEKSNQLLKHLHFSELASFRRGLQIQERIVRANLDYKQLKSSIKKSLPDLPQNELSLQDLTVLSQINTLKPFPTLLTFEFNPTYTGGKRIKKQITNEQIAKFERFVPKIQKENISPVYLQLERGGEITFHGPGQLVAFFILDLKSFTNLTARRFVSILEQTTMNTLLKHRLSQNGCDHEVSNAVGSQYLNLPTKLTEKTGVWSTNNKKIASLGIHVRRAITSHGLSINVNTDLSYANSFELCGIPNGEQTSVKEQKPFVNVSTGEIATTLVKEFANLIGINKIETMNKKLDDSDI